MFRKQQQGQAKQGQKPDQARLVLANVSLRHLQPKWEQGTRRKARFYGADCMQQEKRVAYVEGVAVGVLGDLADAADADVERTVSPHRGDQ